MNHFPVSVMLTLAGGPRRCGQDLAVTEETPTDKRGTVPISAATWSLLYQHTGPLG